MSTRPASLTVSDLPFKSILDIQPKHGQYILMAWDIRGYSGIESIFWDAANWKCRHCVMWLPMAVDQLFTRACAVNKSRRMIQKLPLLKWHEHFSIKTNNKYISLDKLPKAASMEKFNG